MARSFVLFSLVISVFSAWQVSAEEAKHTHGFLLFGKGKTYLTLLSSFEAPHAHHVAVAVTVDADVRKKLDEEMKKDEDDGRKSIYTVTMSLELDAAIRKQVPFSATIYRGDYRDEKNRTQLFSRKTITVSERLYYRPLKETEGAKDVPYLLFGTGTEAYLVRLLVAAPDYLQVLSVDPKAAKAKEADSEKLLLKTGLTEKEGDSALDGRLVVKKQLFREDVTAPKK